MTTTKAKATQSQSIDPMTDAILAYRTAKAAKESAERAMKDAAAFLMDMIPAGESLDNEIAKVTHVAPHESTTVDTAKVKAVRGWEKRYAKTTNVSGSIRVTVK